MNTHQWVAEGRDPSVASLPQDNEGVWLWVSRRQCVRVWKGERFFGLRPQNDGEAAANHQKLPRLDICLQNTK